ncbi:hypothetical protein C900_03602 [Fulvivirga imtechensis AK7]|uniref:Uncharacterized protein n=1 Tax=Fulvivirga imtechensis AK7 TaxID=1237149 RepID=L8JNT1_9BACT|nr:hypothetical protein [Fulvivirga imtechensis]ELR70621.1 hypothetical protein C900_03602 [Fulvivirga imtechensis AK7]
MKSIFVSILVLFFTFSLRAQPGDPGGGGKPVPIGGVELLLLAGGALGIRKIVKQHRKR